MIFFVSDRSFSSPFGARLFGKSEWRLSHTYYKIMTKDEILDLCVNMFFCVFLPL